MSIEGLTQRHVHAEIGRRGLASFVEVTTGLHLHAWQRNHLCPLLERARTERGLRVAIHGPPQYGKSLVLSKRLPAWLLGQDPLTRVVLAGYNAAHATSQFAEPLRNLMLSPLYRAAYPAAELARPAAAAEFSTLARARRNDGQDSVTALGLLTGFTGKGLAAGDLLLMDDPYASPDEAASSAVNERVWRFWDELAANRVDERANVFVMFHRYHEDDLAGRLLATGEFEYVRFPAIADENEDGSDPTGRAPGELLSPLRSPEWLRKREAANPRVFLGQFQGRPRPTEGTFFRRSDFQIVEPRDWPRLARWVRGWDVALSARQSADETVGTKVGVGDDGGIYIEDQVAFRAEFPDLKPRFLSVMEGDGPGVPVAIERQLAGLPVMQDLQRHQSAQRFAIYPVNARGDKKTRASAWASRARTGKLFLRRGPWNEPFIGQCLAFTGDGTGHDDRIDSVSVAMEHLYAQRGGAPDENLGPAPGTPAYYRSIRGA